MSDSGIIPLAQVLAKVHEWPEGYFLFFPENTELTLGIPAIVADVEVVPAEEENEPDAGYPEIVKQNRYVSVMEIATLKDILHNAFAQIGTMTVEQFFIAFRNYYYNDAFIDFTQVHSDALGVSDSKKN